METRRRSQLAGAADYGYCRSHSRYFWGFRLQGLFALDGTPRALALTSPKRDERDVAVDLLARCSRAGGEIVLGDKGYVSRHFAATAAALEAHLIHPRGPTNPTAAPTWPRSASRSSRSSGPAKTLLGLERHGARTLHGLRVRLCQRFLALAAAVALNHRLGRPSRSLAAYTT